jgi:hypothetical protein
VGPEGVLALLAAVVADVEEHERVALADQVVGRPPQRLLAARREVHRHADPPLRHRRRLVPAIDFAFALASISRDKSLWSAIPLARDDHDEGRAARRGLCACHNKRAGRRNLACCLPSPPPPGPGLLSRVLLPVTSATK